MTTAKPRPETARPAVRGTPEADHAEEREAFKRQYEDHDVTAPGSEDRSQEKQTGGAERPGRGEVRAGPGDAGASHAPVRLPRPARRMRKPGRFAIAVGLAVVVLAVLILLLNL
jgi:hypothetical protein